MTGPPSAALVAAACRGERQALTELVSILYPQVWRYCRHLTGDAHLADDLAQDTMIRLCRRLDRYDGSGSVAGWTLKIARNLTLDEVRATERRTGREQRAMTTAPTADPGSHVALSEAIAALPISLAEPLLAAEVMGLRHAEIAEALDIPVGTVKSRVHRARAQLHELLREDRHV